MYGSYISGILIVMLLVMPCSAEQPEQQITLAEPAANWWRPLPGEFDATGFIVGGNWRIIEYGQNFGTTAWFPEGNGVAKHADRLAAKFEKFRKMGIMLVRVGLLDDGRAMFDAEGKVVGFNQTFRHDVATFLALAARQHVKVEFALMDFLLAGKAEEVNGVWIRGRRKIFADREVRLQFLQNFLEPFLEEFGQHPALFGFDLINEPEWIIAKADGGAWEDVKDASKATAPISGEDFRNFISTCMTSIRQHAPGKFITIGVSCPHLDLVRNLDVDYLALHYYPWMRNLEDNLSNVPKNKPWMLEEFPGKGDISAYLDQVFQAGGAGALLWNLNPGIDDAAYQAEDEERKLQEIRRFIENL